MDRGVWWSMDHGVAKSRTWLKWQQQQQTYWGRRKRNSSLLHDHALIKFMEWIFVKKKKKGLMAQWFCVPSYSSILRIQEGERGGRLKVLQWLSVFDHIITHCCAFKQKLPDLYSNEWDTNASEFPPSISNKGAIFKFIQTAHISWVCKTELEINF